MYVVVSIETGDLDSPPVAAYTVVVKSNGREGKLWDLRNGGDDLTSFLYEYAAGQTPLITFNGTGFGFKCLASITRNVDRVETLALLTHDIFLDFATENGYFVSLNSFTSGCGLPGRGTASSNDYDALAAQADRTANAIANVVDFLEKNNKVYRLSKAGKKSMWQPRGNLFRVAHKCIEEYENNPIEAKWLTSKPDLKGIWAWI